MGFCISLCFNQHSPLFPSLKTDFTTQNVPASFWEKQQHWKVAQQKVKCVKVEKYCESNGAPAQLSDFQTSCLNDHSDALHRRQNQRGNRQVSVTENDWRWHLSAVAPSPDVAITSCWYLTTICSTSTPTHTHTQKQTRQILTFRLIICSYATTHTHTTETHFS